jgi:hypothetical protein
MEPREDTALQSVCEEERTRLGRLVRGLVRVRFLPVRLAGDGRSATFGLCTGPALLSFFLYYIPVILLIALGSFFPDNREMAKIKMEKMKSGGPVDFFSGLSYNICFYLTLPALPLVMGRSVPPASLVTLSPALPWPRQAAQILLCRVLAIIAYMLCTMIWCINLTRDTDMLTSPAVAVGMTSHTTAAIVIGLYIVTSDLLVCSWLELLGDLVEQEQPAALLAGHLKLCLAQYRALDSALGTFFLFTFSVHQLTGVLCLYLSLTGWLSREKGELQQLYGSPANLGLLCTLWPLAKRKSFRLSRTAYIMTPWLSLCILLQRRHNNDPTMQR